MRSEWLCLSWCVHGAAAAATPHRCGAADAPGPHSLPSPQHRGGGQKAPKSGRVCQLCIIPQVSVRLPAQRCLAHSLLVPIHPSRGTCHTTQHNTTQPLAIGH